MIDQIWRIRSDQVWSDLMVEIISEFVQTIGFNQNRIQIDRNRLQEKRIQCLHSLIQSESFVKDRLIQSELAESISNQITPLLHNTVQVEFTVKFLQDYLNNTAANEDSLIENVKKLLWPIIGRLKNFLNDPKGEYLNCVPNLMSSLITILGK